MALGETLTAIQNAQNDSAMLESVGGRSKKENLMKELELLSTATTKEKTTLLKKTSKTLLNLESTIRETFKKKRGDKFSSEQQNAAAIVYAAKKISEHLGRHVNGLKTGGDFNKIKQEMKKGERKTETTADANIVINDNPDIDPPSPPAENIENTDKAKEIARDLNFTDSSFASKFTVDKTTPTLSSDSKSFSLMIKDTALPQNEVTKLHFNKKGEMVNESNPSAPITEQKVIVGNKEYTFNFDAATKKITVETKNLESGSVHIVGTELTPNATTFKSIAQVAIPAGKVLESVTITIGAAEKKLTSASPTIIEGGITYSLTIDGKIQVKGTATTDIDIKITKTKMHGDATEKNITTDNAIKLKKLEQDPSTAPRLDVKTGSDLEFTNNAAEKHIATYKNIPAGKPVTVTRGNGSLDSLSSIDTRTHSTGRSGLEFKIDAQGRIFAKGCATTESITISILRAESDPHYPSATLALKKIDQVPPSPSNLETEMRSKEMVEVTSINPNIRVDMKYSTDQNFTGEDLYGNFDKAFLHREVAQKLSNAQNELQAAHPEYRLKVYDAARPVSVQKKMYERGTAHRVRPGYIADPNYGIGSVHNYGAAVDLTIEKADGTPLDMGVFDDFEYNGHTPAVPTPQQKANQKILKDIMESVGFTCDDKERWHFNGIAKEIIRDNPRNYPKIEGTEVNNNVLDSKQKIGEFLTAPNRFTYPQVVGSMNIKSHPGANNAVNTDHISIGRDGSFEEGVGIAAGLRATKIKFDKYGKIQPNPQNIHFAKVDPNNSNPDPHLDYTVKQDVTTKNITIESSASTPSTLPFETGAGATRESLRGGIDHVKLPNGTESFNIGQGKMDFMSKATLTNKGCFNTDGTINFAEIRRAAAAAGKTVAMILPAGQYEHDGKVKGYAKDEGSDIANTNEGNNYGGLAIQADGSYKITHGQEVDQTTYPDYVSLPSYLRNGSTIPASALNGYKKKFIAEFDGGQKRIITLTETNGDTAITQLKNMGAKRALWLDTSTPGDGVYYDQQGNIKNLGDQKKSGFNNVIVIYN